MSIHTAVGKTVPLTISGILFPLLSTSASAQTLSGLEILGPSEVFAGEMATYTIHAAYDHGMEFEVTLCAGILLGL